MQEILFFGILSLDSQHQKNKDEVENGIREKCSSSWNRVWNNNQD